MDDGMESSNTDFEMVESTDKFGERNPNYTPPLLHPATTVKCSTVPWYVMCVSAVAAIGGILFGYDMGIVAGAILLLRSEGVFDLSCLDQELIVGSMLIGAVLGACVGGFLIDQFGRKRMIMVNSFVFVAGGLVLATASTFTVLIVGRVCVGVAVSISAIADCIYISEISPPKHRGMLVSMNEFAITIGFLLAYLMNYIFIDTPSGWRYMFGISSIPCIIQFIVMFFLPESPRHHILKGHDQQAEKVLVKLRQTTDVKSELLSITNSIASEKAHSVLELVSSRENFGGRMFVAVGLTFLQQMTGQPNVLLYTPLLFGAFGFTTTASQTLATVGVGIAKMIAALMSILLLDWVGRRRLLMAGAALMAISAACVATVAWVMGGGVDTQVCVDTVNNSATLTGTMGDNSTVTVLSNYSVAGMYISLVAVWIFVMAYAMSFGPGTWLIMSEIFPSNIRGRGMAIATVVNWLTNAVVSLTFLDLIGAIHIHWTFLLYTIVCVISFLFIFTVVPETKNRSLEQISSDMRKSSLRNRFMLAIQAALSACKHKVLPVWSSSPQMYARVMSDDPDGAAQLPQTGR